MGYLKKFTFGLVSLVLLLLCVGGCTLNNSSERKHAPDINTKQCITLAAYRHLAPGNMDGLYCSKILGVWEPLITRDSKGLPKGCLATSWQMLEGGKKWIFHLRQGVTFHNGTPFNADAVLKNFDRMRLGCKRSTFYWLDIDVYYPSLISYEKLDPYTICLNFAKPNLNQLYKMMDFGSPIYAPECFAEDGNFKGFALGTGPYRIKENVLDQYVRLERYEHYYGDKAHIPEIIIRSIPNADTRYAALKAGEILGVLDLKAIPPVLADEISKDPRFAISTSKSSIIHYLYLNGSKFPFNDVRMRQAVSLAIDRKKLAEALYLNFTEPTTNILNYTSPYYKAFPVSYDLQKAKELAKQVLKGQRYQAVFCINGNEIMQKGEAELLVYWLEQIGLDIRIQSLERATSTHQLRKGRYDIARAQTGLANGEPYDTFQEFMTPEGSRNLASSSAYKNREVLTLMDQAKHVEDEEARRRLYNRLQEISVEEQPIVPLFNDKTIIAHSKHLKNYDALIYGIDLAKIEWVD